MAAPALGDAPFWYLTRSTGITSFVLLTIAMAFGVAATQRALASPAWPRFATQALHRNVSLLGLAFLLVHIPTTIVDGYVSISWWSVVLPGLSDYRTLWVALGTLAFDAVVLAVVSSLLRLRLSAALWRGLHLTTYAAWPLMLLHFLKTGTDAAHGRFGLWIAYVSLGIVVAAAGVRVLVREQAPEPVRSLR